jgi:polysaccharide deacetylase 2 family uncharacterized protein YibQ
MPRRKSKSSARPQALWALGISALLLFAAGEIFLLVRSESGQLMLARQVGLTDPARLTQIVGREIKRGLQAAGVPADSIDEAVPEAGAPLRWRVGIKPGASVLQANYAVTHSVELHGGVVLDGRETWTDRGDEIVTLTVGLPGRTTHEVKLVRVARSEAQIDAEPARLALVLYAIGDEPGRADSIFAMRAPFAVALVPGGKGSNAIFRAAHERSREVVLHLPLEPIHYPQLDPGPGTILVTMKPAKIAGTVRHYLDQAEPVAAVANHMGSLATQDMTVMSAIYRELRRDHLPFLHMNPAAGAVCKSLASQEGVTYDEPDMVLDGETRGDDTKALDRAWNTTLDEARRRGHLVVMLRATPLAMRWLPRALDAKHLAGVSVVPLSSLIRKPATL